MPSENDFIARPEIEKELGVQRTLTEIGALFANALDIDSVWPEIVEAVRQLIAFDRLVISTVDSSGETMSDVYVAGTQILPGSSGNDYHVNGQPPLEEVIHEGRPILQSEEYKTSLAETNPGEALRLKAGLKSHLAVPILWQQKVVGALSFRSNQNDAFDVDDQETAERIAVQVAAGIVVLRTHREAVADAKVRSTLAELGRDASSSGSIERLGEYVSEALRSYLEYDRISISSYDSEKQILNNRYLHDRSDGSVTANEIGQPVSSKDSVRGLAVEERVLVVVGPDDIEDLSTNYPGIQALIEKGTSRGIVVPMTVEDRVIGVVSVMGSESIDHTALEVDLVQQVVDQIAPVFSSFLLQDELKMEIERGALLASISRTVSSGLSIDEVFDSFADELQKIVPYDRLAIG
ncbi:MAG: GAF domain-containing protein, partial [Chloroflexi bacterium]|nr:GAF domain-containing protein [Chloroflexota bacterium]